jgi:hypothetical protein
LPEEHFHDEHSIRMAPTAESKRNSKRAAKPALRPNTRAQIHLQTETFSTLTNPSVGSPVTDQSTDNEDTETGDAAMESPHYEVEKILNFKYDEVCFLSTLQLIASLIFGTGYRTLGDQMERL